MKNYTVEFIFGFIAVLIFILVIGCGSDFIETPEPDAMVADTMLSDTTPPEPDLMLIQSDPVQACYDIAQWLSDKILKCSKSQTAADKFKKDLEDGWDCPTITGIRDSVELYIVCQPAIKALSCIDFKNAEVPKSCMGQLQ